MYVVAQNPPIPKHNAKDSESKQEETQRLQWAQDVHTKANCKVKEIEQDKAAQQKEKEFCVAKKAEEECEGYTTPITRIPFQGWYQDDGNHNNIDTLQYESLGDET